MKTKQEYINEYLMESEEGRQIYIKEVGDDFNYDDLNYIESVNGIAGYYLLTYKDDALKVWLNNLNNAKQKWSTDEKITEILKTL